MPASLRLRLRLRPRRIENHVSLQFVWSLGERLENLRTVVLLGLKVPSADYLSLVDVRLWYIIRETRATMLVVKAKKAGVATRCRP